MSVDTRQASGERAGTRPVRAQRSGVSKGQLKKSQTIAPWVLLAPFLAVFLLTFVLPIIYAVFQSFTTVRREGLFGDRASPPSSPGSRTTRSRSRTTRSRRPSAGCCCSA